MTKAKQRSVRIVFDDDEGGYGDYTDYTEDDRTRNEKISDYARDRDRDDLGRFLSKKEKERAELDAYYHSPYKIVYEPKRGGPDYILHRTERMHWHQKLHVWVGLGLIACVGEGLFLIAYEAVKALTRM